MVDFGYGDSVYFTLNLVVAREMLKLKLGFYLLLIIILFINPL